MEPNASSSVDIISLPVTQTQRTIKLIAARSAKTNKRLSNKNGERNSVLR